MHVEVRLCNHVGHFCNMGGRCGCNNLKTCKYETVTFTGKHDKNFFVQNFIRYIFCHVRFLHIFYGFRVMTRNVEKSRIKLLKRPSTTFNARVFETVTFIGKHEKTFFVQNFILYIFCHLYLSHICYGFRIMTTQTSGS